MYPEIVAIQDQVDKLVRGGKQKAAAETYERLYGTHPEKPGEFAELQEALQQGFFDPSLVGEELADILYYAVMLGKEAIADCEKVACVLGFTPEQVVQCAVIKYRQRLEQGKDKPAEAQAILGYLDGQSLGEPDVDAALSLLDEILSKKGIKRNIAWTWGRGLPIWDKIPQIINALRTSNRRCALKSGTSTGKTTQAPKALLEHSFAAEGQVIVVVNNRPDIAVTTAERIAEEYGESLGDRVGVLTDKVRKTNLVGGKTKLVSMTSDVFKEWFDRDPLLKQVAVVVFDEFDEREWLQDFAAAFTEWTQGERQRLGLPPLAMLFMSATLDLAFYTQHFQCPGIEVEGRTFPVDIEYTGEVPLNEVPKKAAEITADIHRSTPVESGWIYIFMPGEPEVHATLQELERMRSQGLFPGAVQILSYHSQSTPRDRDLVLYEGFDGRRIVVMTSIADRGITFLNAQYGVDSGLKREANYVPERDTEVLLLKFCSKGQAVQRAGRFGRVPMPTGGTAVCYRLMSEGQFLELPEHAAPEIMRRDVAQLVLSIKAAGLSREEKPLRFMDSPHKSYWVRGKETLRRLAALKIAEDGKELNSKGEVLARLGLPPREGAMLIAAAGLGCVTEIAGIAALRTASRALFYCPADQLRKARAARAKFINDENRVSDLLVDYHAFLAAQEHGFESGWLQEHFISFQVCQEVQQAQKNLLWVLWEEGTQANTQPASPEAIQKAILAGLPDKVFRHVHDDIYENEEAGKAWLASTSLVREAELLVAAETWVDKATPGQLLLITNATEIQPSWLLQ